LRSWIELYGTIQGELKEEAVIDELEGMPTGTGAYLAIVRLDRRIPCLIPLHGLKINITHTLVLQKSAKTVLSTTRKNWIVINKIGWTRKQTLNVIISSF
jgi:hypothetical protein